MAMEVQASRDRWRRERRRQKEMVWAQAALIKQKKFPSFKSFVGEDEPVRDKPLAQDWRSMKAALMALTNAQ